jgi:hypothetical protein
MRHKGRRGNSARIGVRGTMLVLFALFGMMLVPALASAIVETPAPAGSKPVNTETPKLTGTPGIGQTLTCSQGVWANDPTGYSYAWLRNGSPIAGQNGSTYIVQAADEGQTISCEVVAANSGGDYTISSLPSGTFRVGFYDETSEGAGYMEQYFNGKTESQLAEANSVPVSAPGATGGINAELHAGGKITGTVIGAATKAPIDDIEVCAFDESNEFFGACDLTNSAGEYTLLGLSSGAYEVEFDTYALENEDYIGELYNDQSLYADYTPVSVSAPVTTGGIDAELLPTSEGGQISGTVTGPGKVALTHEVEVCAYQIKGTGNGCTFTGSGGAYTISGLLSGEYEVEYSASYKEGDYATQYYEGKTSVGEATPVNVKEGKLSALNPIEMHAGGQITGKVTGVGSAPLGDVEACAYSATTEEYSECASTNSNGEYTISSLSSAEYAVEFYVESKSVGNYVSQYYDGKASFSEATHVKVIAGTLTTGINVEMHLGGTVAGTVTDGSTHGALKEIIACVREASGKGSGGRCTSTTAQGEYSISNVADGSRTVEFYAESEGVNYMPQYDNVSVGENATTALSPEMHPGGQITGRVTDASTRAGLAKIVVCAEEIGGNYYERCADTTTGTASVSAVSGALTIPGSNFTQAKPPSFDSKTDDIDFFLTFPTAGTLKWSLFFRNADVGFADSLGISLGANDPTLAEVARKKTKQRPRVCKKTQTRHRGKCVATLVSFAGGSQSVPAGTVEVKVHAGSKALKALKAGHTLHVSGTFTFQSTLGGPPVAHTVSTVVHLRKKASKARKHGKGKKR